MADFIENLASKPDKADLPNAAQRDAFWKGAYELGLLVVRGGERSIRLRPVLDVQDDIIQEAFRIMDQQCRRL